MHGMVVDAEQLIEMLTVRVAGDGALVVSHSERRPGHFLHMHQLR